MVHGSTVHGYRVAKLCGSIELAEVRSASSVAKAMADKSPKRVEFRANPNREPLNCEPLNHTGIWCTGRELNPHVISDISPLN